MSSYRSHKEKTLLEQVERALTPEEESALFTPAGYDFREAEKGGYSNYSYWQSTFRAFFKNRVAVFLLLVMAALLLFTVVQPYLPGQRDPNLIYDNPLNGLPLRNQQPNGEFWFGTNSIGRTCGPASGRAPAPACSSALWWPGWRPSWAFWRGCCGAMSAGWSFSSPSSTTSWITSPRPWCWSSFPSFSSPVSRPWCWPCA